jgi:hypothetical protein
MNQTIEWFINTTPSYFLLGIIGLAIVLRIVYEILTAK